MRSTALAILAMSLAACKTTGGEIFALGGGPLTTSLSNNTATTGVANNNTGDTTSNAFTGVGQGTAQGFVIPNVNNISVTNRSAAGGVVATAERGATAGSFSSGDSNLPTLSSAPVQGTDGNGEIRYFAGTSILRALAGPLSLRQNHLIYGVAYDLDGAREEVAGFVAGEAATSMPTTGSALYNGQFTGRRYLVGSNRVGAKMFGNAQTRADFAAGTVVTNIGLAYRLNQTNSALNGLPYSVRVTGNIVGNAFSGTAAFVRSGSLLTQPATAVGTTTSSSASGGFFGTATASTNGTSTATAPAEFGGSIRIEGDPGDGDGPTAIVGGYGGVVSTNTIN